MTLGNDTFRTVVFTSGSHAAHPDAPGSPVRTSALRPILTWISFCVWSKGLRASSSDARRDYRRKAYDVEADWAFIVPAGVWHNVINTGEGDVRLYSLYSPPEHPDGTVHHTKQEAEEAEHHEP